MSGKRSDVDAMEDYLFRLTESWLTSYYAEAGKNELLDDCGSFIKVTLRTSLHMIRLLQEDGEYRKIMDQCQCAIDVPKVEMRKGKNEDDVEGQEDKTFGLIYLLGSEIGTRQAQDSLERHMNTL